jgi:two-component system nitrogen regulation response regulator NtrX
LGPVNAEQSEADRQTTEINHDAPQFGIGDRERTSNHLVPNATMSSELKFLLVDDDAEKRFLIAHHLAREFDGVALIQCDSGAAAIAHLEENTVHAVVTDNSMSPINGLELITWVRQRNMKFPVVMVTGNPEIEHIAIKAGASVVVTSHKFKDVGPILKNLLQTEQPGTDGKDSAL